MSEWSKETDCKSVISLVRIQPELQKVFMKITNIEKKDNIYFVILEPNWFERIFGIESKIKKIQSHWWINLYNRKWTSDR